MIAKKINDENYNPIPLPEPGLYQGVCYAVYDLGLQKVTFSGQEKIKHQIYICWEIDKRIEVEGDYKGKRYIMKKKYTLSLHEKASLRKDLASWRGTPITEEEAENGIDLDKLIGYNCMINVIHNTAKNGKTYANISAIVPCMKDRKKIKPELTTDTPEWIKKIQAEAIKENELNKVENINILDKNEKKLDTQNDDPPFPDDNHMTDEEANEFMNSEEVF